jgi:hypothetical protein
MSAVGRNSFVGWSGNAESLPAHRSGETDTVRTVPEPKNPVLRCLITKHQEGPMAAAKKTASGRKQGRLEWLADKSIKYEVR